MALMQAPGSVAPGATFKMPLSGVSYTVDSHGFVSVASQTDINSLIDDGFVLVWGGRNFFTATTNPGVGADVTADFAPGSIWINQSTSPAKIWICVSSATGAAVWALCSFSDNILGGSSASFVNIALTGLLTNSAATAVTAFSGGGQGSATLLADIVNNVTGASASSAPYDSVKLQPAAAGLMQIVFNPGTNPIQLFTTGSDTINSFAGNVGVTIQPKGVVFCFTVASATWTAFGSGLNFSVNRVYKTNAATTGLTLASTDVTGADAQVFLNMTGTLGAGANAQLPTVASLVSAIPNAAAGGNYLLRVINTSSANFAWTITTNTGWTLSGTMSIGQNVHRDFLVTLTTLSAATFQGVGAGTI